MTMAFLLDVVIAFLLVTTIVYCWRLNRRLAVLRQGREELAALIASLNQATARAETGLGTLKTAAKDAGEELRETVFSARSLRDELALITETGNNLANRLESRLTATPRGIDDPSVDLDVARAARQPSKKANEAGRGDIRKVLQAVR